MHSNLSCYELEIVYYNYVLLCQPYGNHTKEFKDNTKEINQITREGMRKKYPELQNSQNIMNKMTKIYTYQKSFYMQMD